MEIPVLTELVSPAQAPCVHAQQYPDLSFLTEAFNPCCMEQENTLWKLNLIFGQIGN